MSDANSQSLFSSDFPILERSILGVWSQGTATRNEEGAVKRLPQLVDGRALWAVSFYLFLVPLFCVLGSQHQILLDTLVRRNIYPSARYGKYIRSNTLVASPIRVILLCIRFMLTLITKGEWMSAGCLQGGRDYFAYFVPVSAPPGHGVRVVPDQVSGKHPWEIGRLNATDPKMTAAD